MLISLIFNGCFSDSNFELDDSKKIIIGIDANFAPYTFKDNNGNIVGFDVDLAKEVMKRLNYSIEFKSIDWADKQNQLNSGQIDVIWSGLEIIEDRKEYMIFTTPYVASGQIVFVHHMNNQNKIRTKNDLAGLVVGVQSDSTAQVQINNDNDLKFTIKEMRTYNDYIEAFKDLADRKIDAVICDEMTGRYCIFKYDLKNKIDALNIDIGDRGEVAVGLRKSDSKLCEDIQNTLNDTILDGTAQKISEKWFGKDIIIKHDN